MAIIIASTSKMPGHQRMGREDKLGGDVTALGVEHDVAKLLADCFRNVTGKCRARIGGDGNEPGLYLGAMKNIRHRHHNMPWQRFPADKPGAIVNPNQTFGVEWRAITQKKNARPIKPIKQTTIIISRMIIDRCDR
jgi:hypothetical protein